MLIQLFGREVHVNKSVIAAALLIAAIVIGMIGFSINRGNAQIRVIKSEDSNIEGTKSGMSTPLPAMNSTVKPIDNIKPEEEIKVYVVGCVNQQGIVTLKKGQIIDDAIRAAGGATEQADLNNINLVYKLKENVMLNIKPKMDNQTEIKRLDMNASGNGGEAGTGVEIISDSSGTVVNNGGEETKINKKVNLNTASVGELDTLPGIGVETAKDIVAYREKNGDFKTTQDIMKIPGIKDSKYNKIKDLIVVE